MFHDQGAGESTTTSTSAFPTKCPVSFCLKERRENGTQGRKRNEEGVASYRDKTVNYHT